MTFDQSNEAVLRRTLEDAGCGQEMVRRCLSLARENRCCEMVQLLLPHRVLLLEAMHREQAKIDCLDFLLYQLKKENR